MILEHLKSAIDHETCDAILETFCLSTGWGLALNYKFPNFSEGKDDGFTIKSEFHEPPKFENELELRTIANHTLKTILRKTKRTYNFKHATRFLYNYYNKSSKCIPHVDSEHPNFLSAILFLTDSENDYTQVGDMKIYGNKGDVIIFDSRILHSATGAVDGDYRLTLNIIFEIN